MLNQLQPYIPLFEGYLLAKDPQNFAAELTDPTEKNILLLLSEDLHNIDDYREKAKKLGFNLRLQEALLEFKLIKHLRKTNQIKDDQIGRQIRQRFGCTQFDYPRPTAYTVNDPLTEKQDRLPSLITVQESLEHYLDKKLKTRPDFIRSLNAYSISRIPENTLSALPLSEQEYILQRLQILSHFKPEFISKMLIQYQANKRNTNKNYSLSSNILSQLTKEQIDYLGKMKSDMFSNQAYVQIWFHFHCSQRINKYSQGAEYLSKEELDKKRQEFLEIIKELSHHTQHIIRAYVNRLKEEVFIIDLLVDDPSIERLIEHLQSSYRIPQVEQLRREFIDESQRRIREDEASKYNPRLQSQLQFDRYGTNKAIEDYISKLFSINKDNTEYIKKLSPYFHQKYLRELNIKALLSQGIIPENINDYYSSQQLQQIKDKKQLRFHPTNKKKYKAEDKVQLQVSIKNVKTVHIKIYELSLQKHNLLYTGDIADDINLAFLKPTYEEIYEHQAKNAYAIDTVIIPVELQKKMGVFIVDLHGETITSRAVIRKGSILCLEDLTEAGQKFSFYDEEGSPLTERQGLQVWMKDRPINLDGKNYFEADYQQQAENIKIIASVGNYSQTFQKLLRNQSYRFDVGYLYNAESFLVGKKAKVILYGRLLMNQTPMSLQLLKDTKIRVTLTNYQKISSFYEYDITRWMDNEDQIIEFPIQSYIQRIQIEVTAKIILQTKKDLIVKSNKDITINLGEEKTNFMDFYLQKDKKGNYILNLLGLNGEPITNADVGLVYSINGVNQQESLSARTNSDGKINLGPLTIVNNLRAHISNSDELTERFWSLYQPYQHLNYSDSIHSKVGQVIVLPIDQRWISKDILLFKLLEGYSSEDLSSKIAIKNGTIHLPSLLQGNYLLKILPIDKTITITVMKDSKWEDDTEENMKIYDKINAKIVQIKQNIYQKIAIKDIKVEEKEEQNRVHIQVGAQGLSKEHLERVRVHVLANNFIAPVSVNLFRGQSYNTQPIVKETYSSIKNSSYYSNKTLSDEGAYVWNRQQKGQTIVGNNLDKPGIFLKRALVRDTKQQDERLSQQENYVDECCLAAEETQFYRGRMMKESAEGLRSRNAQRVPLPLNSHNNFLLLSGFLKDNCKGTILELDVPKNYNQLEVYILTPSATIRKCFSLGEAVNRKLKDLRHAGISDTKQNKAWTMSREVYTLAVGQERTVSRDSQWRTVGLKEIFEFAKAKGCSLYDWSSHLLHWHSYTLPQKKTIYDKQCCHQLNTFLKFKDHEFFSTIVRPFISNKINKNFVDYCLLDDIKAIKPYTTIDKLQKLNAFEKCLLVSVLASQGDTRPDAECIVKMMENESDAVKSDYQAFKNRFDTIINAKDSIQQSQTVLSNLETNRERLVEMKKKRMNRMAEPSSEIRLDSGRSTVLLGMVDRREKKMEEKKPFVPVESTKQYTQRTYYNIKNYKEEAPFLVSPSPFWAKLSRFLLQAKHPYFLSQQFMTLSNGIDFVLAASFVSSETSSNFDLQNSGEAYKITARSPMLLYVKEVKELDFVSKFGVQINQRFLDPSNMFMVEDGIRVQRQVEEFVAKKPYISQTVVTNTSGTPLQLQILLDIPKGAIPLLSHEYTQIVSVTLRQYTSTQFKRLFYVPEEGEYPIYPSNACKGSTIIAKCKQMPNIIVKKYLTINKLQSFSDILRSGDKKAILNFIQTKNIFDQNLFSPREILWMLKDKDFYHQLVTCLRNRRYFNQFIWSFAFFHWDITSILEIVSMKKDNQEFQAPFFEYFPYYSTRTHRFANESKSTIRNIQFKQNYLKFLISSIVNQTDEASSAVCFVYYLILQDRLREAQLLLNNVLEKYPNANQIQTDYMRCFLDMSLNTHNFAQARSILAKYKDYPIESWSKLFNEVRNTLQAEDEQFFDLSEGKKSQEFQTQVIHEIGQFKIIQPACKTVQVEIFEINLELFFSECPFSQSTAFTSVKPSLVCIFDGSNQTKEIVVKRSDYVNIRDATVEITETSNGLPPKKIATFSWANPEVKVKVNENAGTLQAFVSKKKQPGAYVKVFSKKDGKEAFYRDGYTDMTGTFRYAMADLEGITEFSILVQTGRGGSTLRVKPPSKIATY